jgi:pyruvate/2-oxoglutarate dehydrogenase complex dihydrolipoamide acyltransferase (E2) component
MMSEGENIVELRVSEECCPQDGSSGSIVLWVFSDGAKVNKGDFIAEFMMDKVTLELESPATGILKIELEPEVEARRGDLVALIYT